MYHFDSLSLCLAFKKFINIVNSRAKVIHKQFKSIIYFSVINDNDKNNIDAIVIQTVKRLLLRDEIKE